MVEGAHCQVEHQVIGELYLYLAALTGIRRLIHPPKRCTAGPLDRPPADSAKPHLPVPLCRSPWPPVRRT
jgi:hypothetical protein